MKILSPAVIMDLCTCTDVSSNLLINLQIAGLITAELVEKIKLETDRTSKAHKLYDFLKTTQKDGDLDHLKKALESSKNSQALDVLELAEANLLSTSSSSVVNKQSASGGVEVVGFPKMEGTLDVGPIRVSSLAGMLINDEDVMENIKEFWKRFPKVQLSVMKPFQDRYANGTVTTTEYVGKVLSTWKGRNGAAANMKNLVEILEKEDEGGLCFSAAAEKLRKKCSLEAAIE